MKKIIKKVNSIIHFFFQMCREIPRLSLSEFWVLKTTTFYKKTTTFYKKTTTFYKTYIQKLPPFIRKLPPF